MIKLNRKQNKKMDIQKKFVTMDGNEAAANIA